MKVLILLGEYYNGLIDTLNAKAINYKIVFSSGIPQDKEIKLKDSIDSKNVLDFQSFKELSVNEFTHVFSIGWRRILKDDFFTFFKDSVLINVHPAILPEFKGYHTEPYVIIEGFNYHGITAHYLTKELDAGDIILQKRINLSPYSTVVSIKNEVQELFPVFFEELLSKLLRDEVIEIPQNFENNIVIAPKRTPSDSELDINKSFKSLEKKIRALQNSNFMPFYINEEGVKVFVQLTSDREIKKVGEI